MKMIWDLPHATHNRFLESLSPVPHLDSVLMGRYIGFIESLHKSNKVAVQLLFNAIREDLSSLTGQNLNFSLNKY